MSTITKRWWTSSANYQELSLTVKGFLFSIVPLLILVAKLKGLDIGESDISGIIESIGNLIMQAGFIITGLMALLGLLRKVKIKIRK